MMCRLGCPTPGAHSTWGECLRAARVQTQSSFDRAAARSDWDSELQEYADARRQGVQPRGTQRHQVRQAMHFAEHTGAGDPW